MRFEELNEEAKNRVLEDLRLEEILEPDSLSKEIKHSGLMEELERNYGFYIPDQQLDTMEYSLGDGYGNVYLKADLLISDDFESAFVKRASKEQYIMYNHRRFYQMSKTRYIKVEYFVSGEITINHLDYIDVAQFYTCENCELEYSNCVCGEEKRDRYLYRETSRKFEDGLEVKLAESVILLLKEMIKAFCEDLLDSLILDRKERYSDEKLISLIESNGWEFDDNGKMI